MEARYHCPVCLGVKMDKLELGDAEKFALDYCQRCGGVWFDFGEVGKLKKLSSTAFSGKITLSSEHYMMKCHSCLAPLDRNAAECNHCGWKNVIDCPVCVKPMGQTKPRNLHLDYCSKCKGVWFDNIELSEIWNGYLGALAKDATASAKISAHQDGETKSFFVDVLAFNPDLSSFGAKVAIEATKAVVDISVEAISSSPELMGAAVEGAVKLAGAAAEAVANSPELAGTVVEVAADAAGSVFEVIADIISGIFS